MKMEDLILVSVDDHTVEPADMFDRHFPERLRDQAPKVQITPEGRERWIFQGGELGAAGLNAVASWPKEEWSNDPVGFAEMRPGCYDIHSRIKDMDANGQLAGMTFPTFPGFAGTHLMNAPDLKLASYVTSAYNDWHIDEWAAAYPGRIMPLGILPVWDIDASVAEVKRLAEKGVRGITFPETPYALDLPSFTTGHWDPIIKALVDANIVMCLHIGGAFKLLKRPQEYSIDQHIIMSPQLSAVAATDLMVAGVFNKFPGLKVAMSEGGIGWIPFLLDRVDLHMRNQTWAGLDLGGLNGTELWRRNFLGCFITNPSSLELRHRIGVESIAWECDYPHSDSTWPQSPEILHDEFEGANVSDQERHLIAWQNACRFFEFDPFVATPKEEASVGALRARAKDVDVSPTSRAEYRRRYEAAHAGTSS
jgi:predicted TIM-barrel fold metal-dependent hydrolase